MIKQLYYWSYGSNLLKARLEERVGKVERICTAVLSDHELVFNCGWKSAYANVVWNGGHKVEGVVYKLDEEQIAKLDRYEGWPYNYEKFYFTHNDMLLFGYWSVNPWFYCDRPPSRQYLNLLILGARENKLITTFNKLIEL